MLHQLADWVLAIVNSVPILFGASPHQAAAIRAVAALLLIVLAIYLIVMRGSVLAQIVRRGRKQKPPN